MLIEEQVSVDAPARKVWRLISDPASVPRFLTGITRWEQQGPKKMGLGARYNVRMRVGSGEMGGLIEIVEFVPDKELAWSGITGLYQRGRWRLREQSGRTRVTMRINYHASGGVMGLLADQLAAPMVRSSMRRSLAGLKARVEKAGGRDQRRPPSRPNPVRQLARQARAARVLTEAGVIRPIGLESLTRVGLTMSRWGIQPAAGYIVNAIRFPNDVAIVDEAGEVTFAEVQERTNALAHAFSDAGVRMGDGVAIMCRNHRGFIEATVGLWKLGATALYLNTSFAGPQLAEVVKREKARTLIYDQEFEQLVGGARRGRRCFIAWNDGARTRDATLDSLVEQGDRADLEPPERIGKSIILTSGTTGSPKGASRSNPGSVDPAVAILSRIPLRARETTLISAPLFHSWGFAHFTLGQLLASTFVLMRKFDPEATLAAIGRHRPSVLVVVPVMMQRILELPPRNRRKYDTSSLRVVAVSGSLLPGELATRFMDEYGDIVYNLYGSTEVAWATIATPEDLRAAPGTAGKPPVGTVLRLYDENDREVANGQSGRIFVANEMMFEGYTRGGNKAMIDGLMSTGDIGHFDEGGRLFVEGRDDEMIVSGGENVFPAEVEDLLAKHRAVNEAAVIGVEDKQFGQVLRAFVVTKSGARLSEDEVKSYVKSNLAGYKVPKQVEFIDKLPRNPTGKVLKRELRERVEAAAGDKNGSGG